MTMFSDINLVMFLYYTYVKQLYSPLFIWSFILQVTHAWGGQYKYIGHTICFPQDITTITNIFPHLVSELDIVIVARHGYDQKSYDFIISTTHVLAALEYKLAHDPYYKDVDLDQAIIFSFLTHPTDMSSLIRRITPVFPKPRLAFPNFDDNIPVKPTLTNLQPSSFVLVLPNSHTKLEEISNYLHSPHPSSTTSLSCPFVSHFAIKECTTKGMFPMAFPTLFLTQVAMIGQPWLRKFECKNMLFTSYPTMKTA